MNWGAAVLIFAGVAIVTVGVTKSQKTVCQALTGTDCTWMPDPQSTTNQQGGDVKTSENQTGLSIESAISSCQKDHTCQGYMTLASNDASNYGVDPNDFVRQIAAESSFNPKAVSPAGAQGIAQLMPATSKAYGVDPFNVNQSLNVAAEMMGQYDAYWTSVLNSNFYGFTGDSTEAEALALSSYNMGLAGTQSLAQKYGAGWFQKAPKETQNYILGIEYPRIPVGTQKFG